MNIVIMGCGKVGSNLASSLISEGQNVTLIETDEAKCKKAAEELDIVIIHGSGTDPRILEEAEIEHADVFVAAAGNDEINLLASSLVRDYKVPKIVARIIDPQHETVFKEAGIKNLVRPELIVVDHLKKLITD